MKLAPLRLALLSVFLALPAGYAQDIDAGPPASAVAPIAAPAPAQAADAGVSAPTTAAPAPAPAAATTTEDLLAHPLSSFKGFYVAAKEGKWALAAMFMLFAFVGFIRFAGKKAHDLIPDDTANPVLKPVEAILRFIFDTKLGGWALNWLSSISGCLAMAYLAGMPVDSHAWRTAVMASTGGTMLIELVDDVKEWWQARKGPVPAPAITVKP